MSPIVVITIFTLKLKVSHANKCKALVRFQECLPPKMTLNFLLSVPYLLVATQVYFPGFLNRIVAMFVVFTSTLFTFLRLFIKAVYKGGVPVAKHDSRWYRNARTREPGYHIFGEAMILTAINSLLFISVIEHLAFTFLINLALCSVVNVQLSKTAT